MSDDTYVPDGCSGFRTEKRVCNRQPCYNDESDDDENNGGNNNGGYGDSGNNGGSKNKCPWKKDKTPDCDNGMCSLRFAGDCVSNLFNRVYQDICQWEEATQLLPVITQWLTPLGTTMEDKWGKCENSAVYNREYLAGEVWAFSVVDTTIKFTDERYGVKRDVATCQISAGQIPCKLGIFDHVQDEVELYLALEKLITYVKPRCNREWQQQMSALLGRFKKALTCPNGISDHPSTYQTGGNTQGNYNNQQSQGQHNNQGQNNHQSGNNNGNHQSNQGQHNNQAQQSGNHNSQGGQTNQGQDSSHNNQQTDVKFGEWNSWQTWSQCGKSCGTGWQARWYEIIYLRVC